MEGDGEDVSGSEISSFQELDERRQEAERAAVESVERRMNDIIHNAMQEYEAIVGEKNVLQMELDSELQSVSTYSAGLAAAQEATRQQLLDMLEVQAQMTTENSEALNLLATLQQLREQNHATLKADPVYALVQEERFLQQQLDSRGIYVFPPTGSGDQSQ